MSRAEQGTIALRRRSGWEAADLGVLLWRNNWGALMLFTGLPMAVFSVIQHFLPEEISVIGAGVNWWLLPFFDRFALQVVSLRFFNLQGGFKSLFRGLGGCLKKGIVGDLLWRRFSPFRSARMPIMVLEKLKGKTLRQRKKMLHGNGLGFGFPITVLSIILYFVLIMGEYAFIFAMFEIARPGYYAGFEAFIESGNPLCLAVLWFTRLLIETIYVCMGFGLYINSRVETEGWDIELLFKNLSLRSRSSIKKKIPVMPALVLALTLFCIPLSASAGETAEEFIPRSLTTEEEKALDDILSSPDFGTEKPSFTIQLKKQDGPKPEPKTRKPFEPWEWLQELLGKILRIVIGGAIAVVVGIAAFFLYKQRGRFLPRRRRSAKNFGIAAGLPQVPEQLLKEAAALHGKGKIREAWALCFRAFSAAFSLRLKTIFPPDATEYETLSLVRETALIKNTPNGPELSAPFTQFVNRWVGFAYGGKEPEPGTFETSLADCHTLLEQRLAQ
jgi:hypothetical protein